MTGPIGGIVDFAVAFPAGRISVQEMHERSGVSVPEILEVTHCSELPALAADELAWELAVEAAADALERSETDPDDVERVIYAGAGYWDAPAWSPAAKVADELAITRAHCFEITNFCNGLTLALRVAVEGLGAASGKRALVVAAERFAGAVDRTDPDSKALFNFGDAATAAVIGRSDYSFAYLGGTARTEPHWCDYFVGDYHETGVHTRRRGRRKGLADAYVENFVALTGETLALVGQDLDDVSYLLVNQNDMVVQERLLAELALPPDRSVFNHQRYGHLGCSDTMIALRGLVDDGALADGDLVLLATSGAGFSWSVTALRYGAAT